MMADNRRILIGDLHGNHRGLRMLLDKVNYSDSDILIFLGDYNDYFPDIGCSTKVLIDDLLRLDAHFLIGNHDQFFIDWMKSNKRPESIWWQQGGKETLASYGASPFDRSAIPQEHKDFYYSLIPYYVDDYVVAAHGGIPFELMEKVSCGEQLSSHEIYDIIWDREMVFAWGSGIHNAFKRYFGDKYFVAGHTAYMGPYCNSNMPKWYMIDVGFRTNDLCALVISSAEKAEIITINPDWAELPKPDEIEGD